MFGKQEIQIPVDFVVPADGQPCQKFKEDEYYESEILWQIRASGKTPGVNPKFIFEVPVYAAGPS
jgi:hypothetical protein